MCAGAEGLVGVEIVVLTMGSIIVGGTVEDVVGRMEGEVSFIWLKMALCSSKDDLVVAFLLERMHRRVVVRVECLLEVRYSTTPGAVENSVESMLNIQKVVLAGPWGFNCLAKKLPGVVLDM